MPTIIPKNTDGKERTQKAKVGTFLDLSLIWFLLIIGFIGTTSTAFYVKSRIDFITNEEFLFHCEEVKREISERLNDHARILLAGAAFFTVSEKVTRDDWFSFTQHQKVAEQLPGIQGIGFSILVPVEEVSQHIQNIRREGFPEYTLYPEGTRQVYTSIIYLEPFTGRNLKAFGYDMFSEPVRREAMERARDTNKAALSGKVTLVQETHGPVQAGNLMYVPIYRSDLPIETLEQRRDAIYGWVYSPYRMNDLMGGVLEDEFLHGDTKLFLQVFDGTQPSQQSLLYNSAGGTISSEIQHSQQIPIEFNNQYWTLIFKQTNGGFNNLNYLGMWFVLFGGTLVTILVCALANVLQKAKVDALNLANVRTKELRISENVFEAMVESLPVAIYSSVGKEQVCEYVNPMFGKLFGYTIEDVPNVGRWWPLAYPNDEYRRQVSEEWTSRIELAINTDSAILPMETEVTCKDGSKKNIAWGYIVAGGKNMAFGIDLTERINIENELSKTKEHYRLLTEISPSGICLSDMSGSLTYVSPRWSEITGISGNEALGAEWSNTLHPEDKAKIIKGWGETIEQNARYQDEFRFIHQNNQIVWVLGLATPIIHQGKTTGWVGTITDITEIKKAEESITKINQELEQRVNSRTAELEEKSTNLEEMNTALKVLLRGSTTVKEEIEGKILNNIKESVLPYLEEIGADKAGTNHQLHIETIKANISSITSSFSQSLALNYQNLTPREIQIANFIRQGKTNKDISMVLNITLSAVDFHRRNIRQKFNIKGKKENLRAHLMKYVG